MVGDDIRRSLPARPRNPAPRWIEAGAHSTPISAITRKGTAVQAPWGLMGRESAEAIPQNFIEERYACFTNLSSVEENDAHPEFRGCGRVCFWNIAFAGDISHDDDADFCFGPESLSRGHQ